MTDEVMPDPNLPAPAPAPSSSPTSRALASQPAVYAFAVTIIGIVGAVVLIALGHSVPDPLWQITGGAGLVGSGALNPSRPA